MAKRGFEEATRALSGYIVAGRAGQGTATLDDVGKVCSILGIDLGRLSAIHIAGTKGKGSTSGTTLFREPHASAPGLFVLLLFPGRWMVCVAAASPRRWHLTITAHGSLD
jgi:hypothetical protein